jgi:phosphoketolase
MAARLRRQLLRGERSCASTAGVGIWEIASNDAGGIPHVVMACCGDVPTLETLAVVDLIHRPIIFAFHGYPGLSIA